MKKFEKSVYQTRLNAHLKEFKFITTLTILLFVINLIGTILIIAVTNQWHILLLTLLNLFFVGYGVFSGVMEHKAIKYYQQLLTVKS